VAPPFDALASVAVVTAGIRARHTKLCPSRSRKACRCRPTYQANVWSARDGKRLFKTFASLAEAKAWRTEAQVALRRGTMRAGSSGTLREAAEAWLDGVKSGAIRNRSGHLYKPSAIRGYEASLVMRVLPELGGLRFSEIRRVDLQDFADRLSADGLDPSTVRNTLMPLRAICRRALARGEVAVNPTSGLELPAMKGARDRIASPTEASEFLEALPERDRAIWATAMYAGLRRGELLALRCEDVDLAAGIIHVERSWDAKSGAVGPKSRAGRRTVPIPAALRDYLVEHKLRSGHHGGLVFGTSYTQPFTPSNVRNLARSVARASAAV